MNESLAITNTPSATARIKDKREIIPGPFDVLLGRGKSFKNHTGNKRFQGTVFGFNSQCCNQKCLTSDSLLWCDESPCPRKQDFVLQSYNKS